MIVTAEYARRLADAMLCVHDVVLGKELTFLYPAPRALRLVSFTRETRSRNIIEPILSKIGERELQRSS